MTAQDQEQKQDGGHATSTDTRNSWDSHSRADGRPYKDKQITGKSFTRVFSVSLPSEEFKWHRDSLDRFITVLNGVGWYYQLDNQLPTLLKPGDVIEIRSEVWHRVLPGVSDLEVLIEEE